MFRSFVSKAYRSSLPNWSSSWNRYWPLYLIRTSSNMSGILWLPFSSSLTSSKEVECSVDYWSEGWSSCSESLTPGGSISKFTTFIYFSKGTWLSHIWCYIWSSSPSCRESAAKTSWLNCMWSGSASSSSCSRSCAIASSSGGMELASWISSNYFCSRSRSLCCSISLIGVGILAWLASKSFVSISRSLSLGGLVGYLLSTSSFACRSSRSVDICFSCFLVKFDILS